MTKTEQLQQILDQLERGRFTDAEKQKLVFRDATGARVRLSDPGAADALRERIAKEESK